MEKIALKLENMTPEEAKAILANVPEAKPELDEVETLEQANESISEHGTAPHDSINWD